MGSRDVGVPGFVKGFALAGEVVGFDLAVEAGAGVVDQDVEFAVLGFDYLRGLRRAPR